MADVDNNKPITLAYDSESERNYNQEMRDTEDKSVASLV
jgi:hypothetical protein